MARKSNFTPYGEQIVETFDEDADHSEFVSYHFARSTNDDRFVHDDPAPLFLSSQIEQSRAPGRGKNRDRVVFSSLTLKASALVALAAVIVFSVLSVENPLAVFANTKASLLGLTVGLSNANSSTPAIQTAVDIRTSPVTLREAPTRDEIAAAFRAAQQSQPEIRFAPPPPPAPQPDEPPIRRLSADELAVLMKRAKSLIAVGDIAPARLLLERAADAQEASAALLLAQTYDPAVLGTQDMRSITPDPATARSWYEKAARFGSLDAQQRLAQMQN
jgi:TPR repeat protein